MNSYPMRTKPEIGHNSSKRQLHLATNHHHPSALMEPTAPYVSPQDIRVQVNDMDEQVREAVEEGKIRMAMRKLGPHIVSFLPSFEVTIPTFCSNPYFRFGAKAQKPNGRRFHADCFCMCFVPPGMTKLSETTPDLQAICLPPSGLSMPAM